MNADGVVAALLAPLSLSIGFVIWEDKWTGSAFALNLFKCTMGSVLFLATIGILSAASHPPGDGWTDSTDVLMLIVSSVAGKRALSCTYSWCQALLSGTTRGCLPSHSWEPARCTDSLSR